MSGVNRYQVTSSLASAARTVPSGRSSIVLTASGALLLTVVQVPAAPARGQAQQARAKATYAVNRRVLETKNPSFACFDFISHSRYRPRRPLASLFSLGAGCIQGRSSR